MNRIATASTPADSIRCAPVAAQGASSLLVMVTSPEPQVQLMSMVLTMQAAKQGARTRVLLCGAAGDMALRDAPAGVTAGQPPGDMSPQGLMQVVMSQTGTAIEVCAIYLPAKNLTREDLLDGVTAADPAAIGALLIDPATKVLTF